MALKAVLFDWRGTLFHDLADEAWIRAAAHRIKRGIDAATVARLAAELREVTRRPEIQAAEARSNVSTAAHHAFALAYFGAAGLDPELAESLWAIDGDAELTIPYPDVAGVFARLSVAGIRVAVVSDVHYDIRPHFKRHSLARYIDAWALSYEHGWSKPDSDAFATALKPLGVAPEDALMVGDRADRDGGAAEYGIATLILPPMRVFGPRGLDCVLRLAGIAE